MVCNVFKEVIHRKINVLQSKRGITALWWEFKKLSHTNESENHSGIHFRDITLWRHDCVNIFCERCASEREWLEVAMNEHWYRRRNIWFSKLLYYFFIFGVNLLSRVSISGPRKKIVCNVEEHGTLEQHIHVDY